MNDFGSRACAGLQRDFDDFSVGIQDEGQLRAYGQGEADQAVNVVQCGVTASEIDQREVITVQLLNTHSTQRQP